MSLNESIVVDAAREWFGELGYAVGHGAAFAQLRRAKPSLAPGEPAAERNRSAAEMDEVNSFGEVVLVGRLREAIRWLNPNVHQSRLLATLRDTLLPKLLSEELSVGEFTARMPAKI